MACFAPLPGVGHPSRDDGLQKYRLHIVSVFRIISVLIRFIWYGIRKGLTWQREGITFEQVAAAADALVGEGQQPTIRAIRERLGTGSPNTVHKHLTAWREARPVAAAAAPELPQALTAAIAAEIERAAAQARAEIEGRLVQAQGEAAELAAAGEVIEAERDALAEQVAELTRERDTLAGKAEQQAVDLADQAQRIEREQQAAESARVELATARLKIEAHRPERQAEQAAEIERLRAALADAQQGRTAAEQQAAVLAAKLEACADRVSRAEARVEQIEQQAAKAAQAHEEARAAATQEARQVQAERDEARKVAAEAREQAARLAGQLEALTAKERKADERP
jgi:colicin import membrane protein